MERIGQWIQRVHHSHERLKDRIHNGMRYPLPRWGQIVMGCIYFSVPILCSYPLLLWVQARAKENLGENGEKLKPVQGIGDMRPLPDGQGWQQVGGSGWGQGARLVTVSHPNEPEENTRKLKAYLKMLKRKHEKQILKAQRKEKKARTKKKDSEIEVPPKNEKLPEENNQEATTNQQNKM